MSICVFYITTVCTETFTLSLHDALPIYDKMQKELLTKEDRETGQYSNFWEARNYRHHADGIKCSWISVHGLNDWNVKPRSEEHTSELQSRGHLVCRLLLEKKKTRSTTVI